MRVLIIEDERKLAQVLSSALQAEHYDVVVSATGEDGFYRTNAEQIRTVHDWTRRFERHWQRQLLRVKERAERAVPTRPRQD